MNKKKVDLLVNLPNSPECTLQELAEKGALVRVFRLGGYEDTDDNVRFIEYVGEEYCLTIANLLEDSIGGLRFEADYNDTNDVNNLFDYLYDYGSYPYLLTATINGTIYIHLVESDDMTLDVYFNALAKANEKLFKGVRFDSGKQNGVVEIGKIDGIKDVVYENNKSRKTIFDNVIKPSKNIVRKIPNVDVIKAPAFIPIKKG